MCKLLIYELVIFNGLRMHLEHRIFHYGLNFTSSNEFNAKILFRPISWTIRGTGINVRVENVIRTNVLVLPIIESHKTSMYQYNFLSGITLYKGWLYELQNVQIQFEMGNS